MRIVSWNVNGLRAAIGRGFLDFCTITDADIYCVQEIKMLKDQGDVSLPGYEQYWNSAEKKGYSGTLVFSRPEPVKVSYGVGAEEHDKEGRSVTLEFDSFYLVNEYTPNARNAEEGAPVRLDFRMEWEDKRREYLKKLDKKKPVILCGDLNVAPNEIDLKNPGPNRGRAGFTDEERGKFAALLQAGFTDSFRFLYPEKEGAYTWWSYRFGARANNAGWRIDHFIVSDRIAERVNDVVIMSDVQGSDHCPVLLDIAI